MCLPVETLSWGSHIQHSAQSGKKVKMQLTFQPAQQITGDQNFRPA